MFALLDAKSRVGMMRAWMKGVTAEAISAKVVSSGGRDTGVLRRGCQWLLLPSPVSRIPAADNSCRKSAIFTSVCAAHFPASCALSPVLVCPSHNRRRARGSLMVTFAKTVWPAETQRRTVGWFAPPHVPEP